MFKLKIVVIVALIALATACNKAVDEPLVQLAADTLPKTAMIECRVLYTELGSTVTKKGTCLGSGVVMSPTGHILTAAHLFNYDTKEITVTLYNGDTYRAELLYRETRRDLALIKINGKALAFARLADPRSLRVGQTVIAIGNPMGLDFSVCHGIISALNRDFTFAYNVTQSDAMINPGNSGGPLFNLRGELVGINSFIYLSFPIVPINSGLGFSVSPGQIIEFTTNYRKTQKGRV